MGVDTPTAERASRAIRAALEAQLPNDAWVEVDDLVRRIDAAIDAADNDAVVELAGQLETVGESAVRPSAMPTQLATPSAEGYASGTRRGRLALIIAAAAGVIVALAVSLTPGPAGDSPPPSPAKTVDPEFFEELPNDYLYGYREDPFFPSDGLLEIELVWRGDADLDLEVEEPDGTLLTSDQPGPTPIGGRHGGDDNATTTASDIGDCKSGSSREVVSWHEGAPPGPYHVDVLGYNVAPCPGHYVLNARTMSRTVRYPGSVGNNGDIDTVELYVEHQSSSAVTSNLPPTDEAGGGKAQNDDGGAANGTAWLLALGAGAAIALTFVWIVSRITRPRGHQNVHVPADLTETAPPVRPLLLAPEQLREVANHTIHRLDVLSS